MRRDALVVGINQYPFLKDTPTSKAKHLKTPASDAEAIAQLLEEHGDFRVKRLPESIIDGKLQVDPNKTVTADELLDEITKLFLTEDGRDTALLFFAGHGVKKPLGQLKQILMATSDVNPQSKKWNGLLLRDLWEIVEQSPVKEQIIWLDSCHSGELLEFKDSDFPGRTSERRRLIIAASHSSEVAYERLDGKHGVLSGALIAGLNPNNILQGDWITDRTLADFVEKELKEYYEQTKIHQITQIRRPDQEILLIKKGLFRTNRQSETNKSPERKIPFVLPQLDVSTFTGRDDELKQLEELLLKSQGAKFCSIAGLAGVGGIGKSALACHFATIHKADFIDGVIGLRVDGKDADTIAHQFVSRLGEEIAPDDERDAATIMQEVFAYRRMLLIFDNADNDSIRQLFPGGSRCAVIVTTRDRGLAISLGVPVPSRINLPKLSETDALLLLKEVIDTKKQRVEAEPEAAHQLIKLVDYLPLAIKIIGLQLSLHDRRSLAEQIEILTEEQQLAKMQFGDSEHFSLFACFSLSLKHLTLDEINFFACLSVCAKNGFSLQIAMAATNCNKSVTRKYIDDKLFRLSLINYSDVEKHHFVFHPLIYEFAALKADELGLYEEAAARHAEYFIQFVSREINHEVAQEIARELDDIILAAEWLQLKTSKHQEEDKYEFAVCLQPFFEQYGYWEKAVHLMRGFEKLAESSENWEKVIKFRIQQAKYLSLLGKLKSAEKLINANTILPILNKIDNESICESYKAKWLNTLGSHILMRQNKFDKAIKAFKLAIKIEEKFNNQEGLVISLNILGRIMRKLEKFKEAEKILNRSYRISKQLDDKRQIAFVLHDLGLVFLEQNCLDKAFQNIQSSYAIFKELEHQRSVLITLNSLSKVLEKQGKIVEAIKIIEESLAIGKTLKTNFSLIFASNKLASLYEEIGQFEKALELCECVIEIAQATDNKEELAITKTQLSGLYHQRGEYSEAIHLCQEAIQIAKISGNKKQLTISLNQLGGLYQQQGYFDEALKYCNRALEIAKEIDDNKQQLTVVLTQLCVIYQEQGQLDETIQCYEERIRIYKEIDIKSELPITLNKLSSLYQQQGRNDKAILSLRDSLKIAEEEEEIEDKQQLIIASNQLGALYTEENLFNEALGIFDNAINKAQEKGDKHSLTITLKLLAILYQKQGQIEKAIQSLEQNIKIAEEVNDRQLLENILEKSIEYTLFLCKAYASYVCFHREKSKLHKIEMILRSCYNLCLKIDDKKKLGNVLYRLGEVMYLKGGEDHLKMSCMYFRESSKYNDKKNLSKIHAAIGRSLFELEKFQESAEEFRKAFDINERVANIEGLKIVTPFLIYSLVHLERREEAIDFCERSLVISSDEPLFIELDYKVNSSKQISNPNALKQGIIKFIKKDKLGRIYGFIKAEDMSNDIYFQESSIAPKYISKLRQGSRVEMEVKQNYKGMFAERLWIVTNHNK